MYSVLEKTQSPLSSVTDFILPFADISRPDTIRSSHALDLLAEIYSEDEGSKHDAAKVWFFLPFISLSVSKKSLLFRCSLPK